MPISACPHIYGRGTNWTPKTPREGLTLLNATWQHSEMLLKPNRAHSCVMSLLLLLMLTDVKQPEATSV